MLFRSGQSATVRILGSITSVGGLDILPNNNSTIIFNGTTAQTSPGEINTFYNLTIDNLAGVTFPYKYIFVNGTFTHTAGTYSGQARVDVDSLSSPMFKKNILV